MALDVHQATIYRYVRAGLPVVQTPQGMAFDRAVVDGWMREMSRTGDRGRPPAGAEAVEGLDGGTQPTADAGVEELSRLIRVVTLQCKRLEEAKRRRIEEEAQGRLVPREEVISEAVRAAKMCRDQLLGRFRGLGARLAVERDPVVIDAMLEDVVADALRALGEALG